MGAPWTWALVVGMALLGCGAETGLRRGEATQDAATQDATAQDAHTQDAQSASDAASLPDAAREVRCGGAVCRAFPAPCPEWQVREVRDGCWGECVHISQCVCAQASDCPDNDHYTCHMHAQRCGPYLN